MSKRSDATTCLHCGESRGAVRAEGLFCATLSVGESVEVDEEFEKHRWADWRDRELDQFGIRPDAHDRHRRTPLRHMQWVACDDTKRGHAYAGLPVDDYDIPEGQCWSCGKYADTPTPPPTVTVVWVPTDAIADPAHPKLSELQGHPQTTTALAVSTKENQ